MPRLPRGMFRRGRSYYVRLRSHGQDRWIALGDDLEKAKANLDGVRHADEPKVESGLSVSEAAERWLASYVATARNEQGHALARARVEQFMDRFLGPKLLHKVTREDLRAYRLWLERYKGRRGQLSPQSVAHVLSDARCCFRWCEDAGLTESCPVPRKLLPRIQERPPDRLTDEELAKLTALEEPFGFLIRLALGTALRWGELVRTQAAHVQSGQLIVSQTKSGKVRRVPLSPELLQEIKGRVGKLVPFSDRSLSYAARRIVKLSGVSRFHMHQLRHTAACRWIENGGSLQALQEILGHGSVRMTQRYARLSSEHVLAEARRVWANQDETVATTVASSF
jgi:integrase